MLFRINRIPLRYLFCRCVSSQSFSTSGIDSLRQRALIAASLINLISDNPPNADYNSGYISELKNKSLLTRIKQTINSVPYSEKSKQQLMSLFQTGIELDSLVWRQDQLDRGTIVGQDRKKNFVYFPTYMITGQVFKRLRYLSTGKKILFSHQGIGKTVSASLFWKLTQYIDDYRFNQFRTPIPHNDESILSTISKVVYWECKLDSPSKSIGQKIIDQCQEIKTKNLSLDLQTKEESLIAFYKRIYPNMKVVLIVDQLQSLSRLLRRQQQLKNLLKRYYAGQSAEFKNYQKITFQKIEKQISENQQSIKRLKQIFKAIVTQFHGVLYLSSLDHEAELMKQQGFDLADNDGRSFIQAQQIQFGSLFYKYEKILENADLCLSNVEKVLNSLELNISQRNEWQKIKKITKQKIIAHLRDQKGRYFFTPQILTHHFSSYQATQWKNNLSQYSMFSQLLNLISLSTDSYRKQIAKHLEKRYFNREGKNSLFLLFNKSFQLFGKRNNPYLKVQPQVSLEELAIDPSTDDSMAYDRKLFLYTRGEKFVKLTLSPEFLVTILQPIVLNNFSFYISELPKLMESNIPCQSHAQVVRNLFILGLTIPIRKLVIPLGIPLQAYQKQQLATFTNLTKPNNYFSMDYFQKKQQSSFLKMLLPSIKSLIDKKMDSMALFHLYKRQYQYEIDSKRRSLLLSLKQTGIESSSLNFILLKRQQKQDQRPTITINFIAITSKNTFGQTVFMFLTRLMQWDDRRSTEYNTSYTKQKEEMIDIKLKLICIGPQELKVPSTAKYLNDQIDCQTSHRYTSNCYYEVKFSDCKDSRNICQAETYDGKNHMLTHVVYVNFEQFFKESANQFMTCV